MWDLFHYGRQMAFACVIGAAASLGMMIRSQGQKIVRGKFSAATHTEYVGLWVVTGIGAAIFLWNALRVVGYFMGFESLTAIL